VYAQVSDARRQVLVAWSGGKDCSLALYEILRDQEWHVAALLTTLTEGYDRISMHGVRRTLLEEQAARLSLPLEEVWISQRASNEEYESKMRHVLEKHRKQGVDCVAFGDIYLEGIRQYREENLAKAGMTGVFPLWGQDTRALMRRFLELDFKAVVTCVDLEAIDGAFAGRRIDETFVRDLPPEADPCGEKGEFHSFVYDGPIFDGPIGITVGETVLRDGRFLFCDLAPVPPERAVEHD